MWNSITRVFLGLRLRLVLLVALVCAPLVGLALHSASEGRRRQTAAWKERARELAAIAAQQEQRIAGQTRQLLLAMGQSSAVRSAYRRGCKRLVDDLFASYPRYTNLGVLSSNGTVLASALSVPESTNLSDRKFFRRALQQREFVVGDFPEKLSGTQRTVTFAYPVFRDDVFRSMVFAELDLDWFNRSGSEVSAHIPRHATLADINPDGTVRFLYPAPGEPPDSVPPIPRIPAGVLARSHGIFEMTDAAGARFFYAFASRSSAFAPEKVISVLGIPEPILFEGEDRNLMQNLIGLAIAAGIAGILGWVASHFVVLRPIRRLVTSNARIAAGEYSVRAGSILTGDELGQLTRSFDQMAQTLEIRDVERRLAERELRRSEQKFRALVQNSTDLISITDEKGSIFYRSPHLKTSLGLDGAEILGRNIADYIWPEDVARWQEHFAELIDSPGLTKAGEFRLRHSDGSYRCIECTSSNHLHDPAIRGIVFNCRDITARKAAEENLIEFTSRLQALSHRLVEVQEAERRVIARELHDEIGQTLTVAELNLQAILQSPELGALKPRVKESLQMVERVLEQVHDISLNLRPSMLDDLGLESALRWYTARQAGLVGFQSEVSTDPFDRRLDPAIETECFRVAQEALTNIAKHSGARKVSVELRIEDGQLHLRVRDDGSGFEVTPSREKAVRGASLGLLSMEERAVLTGGGLEVNSRPGEGTEVHAWFPLKWQQQEEEVVHARFE